MATIPGMVAPAVTHRLSSMQCFAQLELQRLLNDCGLGSFRPECWKVVRILLHVDRLSNTQAMDFPIEIWELLKPFMAPWEWARLCCTTRELYTLRDQVFFTNADRCALQQCGTMLVKAMACMHGDWPYGFYLGHIIFTLQTTPLHWERLTLCSLLCRVSHWTNG